METEEITSIAALVISVISLFWAYFTSRKLEKYKAVVGLEKSYLESRLNEELNLIRELIEALRNGRLLIEKVIEREKSVKIEVLNKTLNELEQKYTDSLLFLEKTHARVGNSAIVIFAHELKNKIRNNLERLSSNDFSSNPNMKSELKEKLAEIKNDESMLIEKLSEIDTSLFSIYKNSLKN